MIQDRGEKHPLSTRMDTSVILNTSVDACFADKIRLNWIIPCLI